MASDVDICNVALALLGDTAIVGSINPPSGGAQASHCARFYPLCVNELLELHQWGFATTRVPLALLANNPAYQTAFAQGTWKYAYAAPPNVANYISVLDPNTTDDYSVGLQMYNTYSAPLVNLGVYTPQPFTVETDPNTGADVILTNQVNAVLRYTQFITDSSRFSPLFVTCLTHLLASKLAGPLLKGDAGRAESKAQLALFQARLADATASDSNQRNVRPLQGAAWMVNR